MRCPDCNKWNRSSLTRCFHCGADLSSGAPSEASWQTRLKTSDKAYIRVDEDGQADVTPDPREILAQQMTELKIRKQDGEQRKQQMMTETPAHHAPSPSSAMVDEGLDLPDAPPDLLDELPPDPAGSQHPFAPQVTDTTRRTARVAIHGLPQANPPSATAKQPATPHEPVRQTPATRATRVPTQWKPRPADDPMAEDRRRHQDPYFTNAPQMTGRQKQKGHSRSRNARRIVNFITFILVVVVLVLAGAVGVTAYREYKAANADSSAAIVTASMKDDQAAHTILIPGEDGQRIHIRELHQTYDVIGGFATVVIPDHTWYENMDVVTDETMTVTLTPSLQTSGARQRAMDPITYEITIPLSPIELVSPDHMRTEVTTAMYSLEFLVRPDSIVTINGADMSDSVDANGKLIYNATVQPKGDNTYTVNVRSPYCRDNSMEVILYREFQEIPLDLAVTTYTSTSLDKYQITCTTLPGADVDVLTPHSDLVITDLNTTGEFTFYAIFDKVGYNTVSIQATYPGKKTSRVDYVIYYLPSADEYTRKAWSLNRSADYAELMGNISFRAENTQIYYAYGSFDSFVSESPQMGIMYCSEDSLSQPVLFQNETKTKWEKGKEYRIYADVYGTYNGMPWLIVRYCYKVDTETK